MKQKFIYWSITCLEESYRLCCGVVCDSETSKMRWTLLALGSCARKNQTFGLKRVDRVRGICTTNSRNVIHLRVPEHLSEMSWQFETE